MHQGECVSDNGPWHEIWLSRPMMARQVIKRLEGNKKIPVFIMHFLEKYQATTIFLHNAHLAFTWPQGLKLK